MAWIQMMISDDDDKDSGATSPSHINIYIYIYGNLPHICGCAVWIYIHGVPNDGTGRRKKEKTVGLLTEASDMNHCIGWMHMHVHSSSFDACREYDGAAAAIQAIHSAPSCVFICTYSFPFHWIWGILFFFWLVRCRHSSQPQQPWNILCQSHLDWNLP